jgi:hypothetical protein
MDYLEPEKTTLNVEFGSQRQEAIATFKTGKNIFTKPISVSDLVTELARDLEITTGVLPNGTRFYSGTKTMYRIGIQVPAKKRTTRFSLLDASQSFTVPFPEMLFIFSVQDKRIFSSLLFACIPPIGRPQDRLYSFPFGNVYGNDGKICWGDVHQAAIEEPIMLDTMIARFFGSVFSGHLVNGTSLFNPPDGVVNLRTLLESLSNQEFFPDNILKTSQFTIDKAMSERGR